MLSFEHTETVPKVYMNNLLARRCKKNELKRSHVRAHVYCKRFPPHHKQFTTTARMSGNCENFTVRFTAANEEVNINILNFHLD